MFLIYENFLVHYADIFIIVLLISAISVSDYNLFLRRNVLFTYCVKTDSLQILKKINHCVSSCDESKMCKTVTEVASWWLFWSG